MSGIRCSRGVFGVLMLLVATRQTEQSKTKIRPCSKRVFLERRASSSVARPVRAPIITVAAGRIHLVRSNQLEPCFWPVAALLLGSWGGPMLHCSDCSSTKNPIPLNLRPSYHPLNFSASQAVCLFSPHQLILSSHLSVFGRFLLN